MVDKTQEFLQKLAPCIERGELEACVEEAARLTKVSSRPFAIAKAKVLVLKTTLGLNVSLGSIRLALPVAGEEPNLGAEAKLLGDTLDTAGIAGGETPLVSELNTHIKNNDVVIFTESHHLIFSLGWFIVNVLTFLKQSSIDDLVTEFINVGADKEIESIKDEIKELPFNNLKEKIKWLRTKIESENLTNLKKNLVWIHNRDDVLWLIIEAVENGITLHGASTPDMNIKGGISRLRSYELITDIALEQIKNLKKKKVAGYFGLAHGLYNTYPIYFKTEEIGTDQIKVGGNEHRMLGARFDGSRFTIAQCYKNANYLHVFLLIGAKQDVVSIKGPVIIKQADFINSVLEKGKSSIKFYPEDRQVTIVVPTKLAKSFLPTDIDTVLSALFRIE